MKAEIKGENKEPVISFSMEISKADGGLILKGKDDVGNSYQILRITDVGTVHRCSSIHLKGVQTNTSGQIIISDWHKDRASQN